MYSRQIENIFTKIYFLSISGHFDVVSENYNFCNTLIINSENQIHSIIFTE
jgi:hypothetical protein